MAQFVKAVLFDLDGTLIDTAADFVRIIGKMSSENNWQTPSEADIREQVSSGASAMVQLMLRHNGELTHSEDELLNFRQQFWMTMRLIFVWTVVYLLSLKKCLPHLSKGRAMGYCYQ